MFVLTTKAVLVCDHGGIIDIDPGQNWAKIENDPILIEPDPLNRPVLVCPRVTPTTPPCTLTISIEEGPSYSDFVTIDGRRVCKDTTTGRTNWSQLATVSFSVEKKNGGSGEERNAGQQLVTIGS